MKRYMIKEIKNITENDKEYLAKGWVCYKRDLGKTKFLVLQDRSGELQAVADDNPELRDAYQKINLGDVIAVRGRAHEEERAPGGIELKVEQLEIVNPCEQPTPIPLDRRSHRKDTDINKRLDYRYLDLRYKPVADIFKLRAEFTKAVREYLNMNDFIEIQTPKIVAAATEGGANLFPIEYFNTDAYLAQSPQFYKQMMMASGVDRVYEIAPAFRAEKSRTTRHVAEILMLDIEMAFINSVEDVMKVVEKMMKSVCEYVAKNEAKQLGVLGKTVVVPKLPFPRVTMSEAKKLLAGRGLKYGPDDELDSAGEKALGEIVQEKFGHDFVFLTEFPWAGAKFYHMRSGRDPKVAERCDLLYKGMEIATIPQREHRYDVLLKQVKEQKVDPAKIKFYLDAFRYGMPPHGGGGIGIDRIVQMLLDLPNIQETILFPRTSERLTP